MLKIIKNKENQKEKLIYNKNLQEKKERKKLKVWTFPNNFFIFFALPIKKKYKKIECSCSLLNRIGNQSLSSTSKEENKRFKGETEENGNLEKFAKMGRSGKIIFLSVKNNKTNTKLARRKKSWAKYNKKVKGLKVHLGVGKVAGMIFRGHDYLIRDKNYLIC